MVISTDPTDQQPVWSSPVNIDPNGLTLNAISCPTTSLCVIVDADGNAVISTDPTAASPTWTIQKIDPYGVLNSVSCSSESLCVAVDSGGNVVQTTDPSASSPTWSVLRVDSSVLTSVSCGSDSFCVAGDDNGNVITGSVPETTGTVVVSASSPAATYKQAAPKIVCRYTGFKSGQTAPATPAASTVPYRAGDPANAYRAACAGAKDPYYKFSYVSGSMTVHLAPTQVGYKRPSTLTSGSKAVLTAFLQSAWKAGITERRVTITLGSGSGAQRCSGMTGTYGIVSCSISKVTVPPGSEPVSVVFAGDPKGPSYDYSGSKFSTMVNVT